jgi:hypothetical protein
MTIIKNNIGQIITLVAIVTLGAIVIVDAIANGTTI